MNVLVLNASYEVLNIARWQRALRLILTGKAEIVETNGSFIHSPSTTIESPSVIRLLYYVNKPRIMVPFSRSNVFMRDKYTCQYCGSTKKSIDLTLDHVIPRSMGGENCWENLVTACRRCNSKKGNRSPEAAGMKLLKKPRAPQFTPSIQLNFRDDWEKYIPYVVTPLPPEALVPTLGSGREY